MLLFVPIIWLARCRHSRSVKIFTEEGLTRNDGYRFSWADLDCVIGQIHRHPSGFDMHSRTDIH